MSDSAKRNKIPPLSLFYILFICRIVVCLTSVHSISTTEINSQALISFVIAMVMTVVFSLPAVFCYKMNKNPIDIKIGISLSCTKCPDTVQAAQRIAVENNNIQIEVIDVFSFKEFKDKYDIMSVPAMVINDEKVYFGSKSIEEVLNLL